ncbi:unnamed protein product [Didymodactylos carnosus]|uniref:Uncharacterized protein n=1 Tax=Didymodactylos carnosus TaxID=1234261 RepID=A0A813XXB0_9BILA|nr:unnamed protein product [Didymodactylos carnosus]CAF1334314.1 unnamed protein product [Didymodactylos carnosus]CAF3658672.1 unnamed protein product [Didymodactylos carnosus]CAF4145745.1 unnamed protein product [Didymodactylos carnosus]
MISKIDTTTPESDLCVLSDDEINADYKSTLRIISIFVILFTSFLGASLSVATLRVKFLHLNPIIINVGKFFGSGVVLATGFIHMLPTAMEALTDSCLPNSWKVYGAYAGLFSMIAVLTMQLIEFIAHQRYRNIGKVDVSTNPEPPVVIEQCCNHDDHQTDQQDHKVQFQEQQKSTIVKVEAEKIEFDNEHEGCFHGAALQESQQHKISTYLLEIGIATHSILIGIALGTTNGSEFVALFIAIIFHQFFEGIALGAQIARLNQTSLLPAICMVIFFAITTPIGIAIGIGIHASTYSPKSTAALLVNGIFDSISAGILIYIALVNLIAAEFSNSRTFYVLRTRLKILYYVSLYMGVALMSIVALWA